MNCLDNEWTTCMYLSIIVIIVSVPVRKAGQVIFMKVPKSKVLYCYVSYAMRGMIYGTQLLEW